MESSAFNSINTLFGDWRKENNVAALLRCVASDVFAISLATVVVGGGRVLAVNITFSCSHCGGKRMVMRFGMKYES